MGEGMLRKENQKTMLDYLYRVKMKGYKRVVKYLSNRLKKKLPLSTDISLKESNIGKIGCFNNQPKIYE